jgi:hypothetical protein
MEPNEVTSTLSPKETIVNILGRLFNKGHISGDELSLMQSELVTFEPEPTESKLDLDFYKKFMSSSGTTPGLGGAVSINHSLVYADITHTSDIPLMKGSNTKF